MGSFFNCLSMAVSDKVFDPLYSFSFISIFNKGFTPFTKSAILTLILNFCFNMVKAVKGWYRI